MGFLCTDTDDPSASELSAQTFAGMPRPKIFQQSRTAPPRRSRLAHSLAVEEAGANVLAEGDESGAATSGESDASPTSPPSGAPVAAAGGAVPAKGSDSAGEPSPQSASATGSPPTSAQTSPEHAAAPAAAAAGDASASATGGVKAQPLPAPAVTSLSGKPTRFVTTKAPDILNAAADIAKPHDDEPSAHANASLVVPV